MWSPNSKEFGVVYGYMPAKTTIFNTRAVATHHFALAPRNTIIFSPNGRFVLVAGFGNLAGQMDIYDLEKGYRKITTIEAANTSVCEWSPDGKHILTATTSPRLRVDNGLRIWHVGGGLMYNEDLNELYHVTWRPMSSTTHPAEDPFHPMPTPHPSALAYLGTKKTPSKPAGAYRPPGARGQITPLAFKREDEGGAAYVRDENSNFASSINGFSKPRRREVPGAESTGEYLPPGAAQGGGVALPPGADGDDKLSKSAAKNKKKREAKKAKEIAERENALNPDGSAPVELTPSPPARGPNAGNSPERRERRGHDRNRSKGNNNLNTNNNPRSNRDRSRSTHQRQRSDVNNHHRGPNGAPTGPTNDRFNNSVNTQGNGAPAPDLTVTSPTTPGGSVQEKKIRGLLKKIRAIDELKMRLAGGEKLEDTQMKKIRTEDGVRKELEGLGWGG